MKYHITTDKVIIEYIAAAGDEPALVHAFPDNPLFKLVEGWVTSCDRTRRLVTLQKADGSKSTLSFDHIVIPKAEA